MFPIYLVTVLYNGAACLAPFVASLRRQSLADWRLIAIDNASHDGGGDVLAGLDARIALRRNAANLGFARAANQGLRAALDEGAAFVILINNDTLLPDDFLARFVERQAALQAAVIAPRIMRLGQPDEAWYAGGHLEDGWMFRNIHEAHDATDTRLVREVDFASGCCLGLTRGVLATVGLLDESFFVYWEDTDFCLRLKRAGIPIHYVSDVVILHEGGHASGGEFSAGYSRLFWCSYMQLLRKHFGFTVALRTLVRLAAKESGRDNRQWRRVATMLAAMARGLAAPLLPPAP